MLNVGIVQMLATPLRVGENLALAERCIERAVGEGAQLVFADTLRTFEVVCVDIPGRTSSP